MTSYTIEQLNRETVNNFDVVKYLYDECPKISAMFDNKLNFRNCPVRELAEHYIFLICRRNEEIRGHLICNLSINPLDLKVKTLYQLSFYVKPESGRTAYHLFQKFIDIGKTHANHIITMLTSHTNIKSSTLENMGFEEIETQYRMVVK
jgi:hypothetical protein